MGTEVTKGVFNITIGGGSGVSGTLGPETFEGTNRYLEVHVNGERLEPRQPFSSVPYAFQASRAEEISYPFHLFDALGNDFGPLMYEDIEGYFVYVPSLRARYYLPYHSPEPYSGSVFFLLPDCQGDPYMLYRGGLLTTVDPGSGPRRYFVGGSGPPVIRTPVSSMGYGDCSNTSWGEDYFFPAEEVVSARTGASGTTTWVWMTTSRSRR